MQIQQITFGGKIRPKWKNGAAGGRNENRMIRKYIWSLSQLFWPWTFVVDPLLQYRNVSSQRADGDAKIFIHFGMYLHYAFSHEKQVSLSLQNSCHHDKPFPLAEGKLQQSLKSCCWRITSLWKTNVLLSVASIVHWCFHNEAVSTTLRVLLLFSPSKWAKGALCHLKALMLCHCPFITGPMVPKNTSTLCLRTYIVLSAHLFCVSLKNL